MEEKPAWNPKYRKRKKYQGATWTPPSQSAEPGEGWWCRSCRQRHGAMSCGLAMEKATDGAWKQLWSCPKTGNVIHEVILRKDEGEFDAAGNEGDDARGVRSSEPGPA